MKRFIPKHDDFMGAAICLTGTYLFPVNGETPLNNYLEQLGSEITGRVVSEYLVSLNSSLLQDYAQFEHISTGLVRGVYNLFKNRSIKDSGINALRGALDSYSGSYIVSKL